MRKIGARRTRGEDKEPRRCADTPAFKGPPTSMTDDPDLIEVIHAGTAKRPVTGGKPGRFDDVRLDTEAGGETKNRARVLGNVGLIKRDAQGQDCGHATKVIVAKLMMDK
jgi:hypothetical protein